MLYNHDRDPNYWRSSLAESYHNMIHWDPIHNTQIISLILPCLNQGENKCFIDVMMHTQNDNWKTKHLENQCTCESLHSLRRRTVRFDCDGLIGHYIQSRHSCGSGVLSVKARVGWIPVFAWSLDLQCPLAARASPLYSSIFRLGGSRVPRLVHGASGHHKHAWHIEFHIWRTEKTGQAHTNLHILLCLKMAHICYSTWNTKWLAQFLNSNRNIL